MGHGDRDGGLVDDCGLFIRDGLSVVVMRHCNGHILVDDEGFLPNKVKSRSRCMSQTQGRNLIYIPPTMRHPLYFTYKIK